MVNKNKDTTHTYQLENKDAANNLEQASSKLKQTQNSIYKLQQDKVSIESSKKGL